MIVMGLTGSIGMGKSTTSDMFARNGVPVHDADASVHALYRGVAAPLIEAAFPGATRDGVVDRALLAERVMENPAAFAELESIIHPLVRAADMRFRETAKAAVKQACLVDIPLLFETGGEDRVDIAVVVTAETAIQRRRVLGRAGMTEQRFNAILQKQMPDAEKRKRAHFLVDTGFGFASAERQVLAILRAVSGM